jgi:hypothetical protein
MKHMLSIISLGLIMILSVGCGSEPAPVVEAPDFNLYVDLVETEEGIALGNLSMLEGDIDLRHIALNEDIKKRFCDVEADEDKGETQEEAVENCMAAVLGFVKENLHANENLAAFQSVIDDNKNHKRRLDKVYNEFYTEYKAGHESILLRYLLNDETKMYKGETLAMSELAYIGLNDLMYPKSALHEENIQNIFPHPVEDFMDDIVLIKNDLIKTYDKDEKVYRRTIRERSAAYPITRKNPLKEGPFTFKAKAKQSIPSGTVGKTRVILRIVGKDIEEVYPYKFVAQNSDLEVEFSKRQVSFKNKTGSQIHLKDVVFSYNGTKKKTALGSNFGFSEVAPGEVTTSATKVFVDKAFKAAASYKEMTKAKAVNTKIEFGIKLRYTVGNSKKIKVLSDTQSTVLWRAITGW